MMLDAELHLMGREQLEMFFKESGKDVTCDAVRSLIEQLVSQQQQQQQPHKASPALLNVYVILLHSLFSYQTHTGITRRTTN
jgi:hypothetical protein